MWGDIQSYISGTADEDPDPQETVDHLNSVIVLLGQALRKLSYERRLSALSAISDVKSAKKQLKEHMELLANEKTNLFGEEFQKALKAASKAQDSAEKIFTNSKKSKLNRNNHVPFRLAPPQNQHIHRSQNIPPITTTMEERTAETVVVDSSMGKEVSNFHIKSVFPPCLKNLENVHPSLLGLFPTNYADIAKGKPIAGRLRFFHQNWRILTSDPEILEIVTGWEIPLTGRPHQVREPHQIQMSELEQNVVDQEIVSMIQKGVIQEVNPVEGQFLSTIFVRPKKEKNRYRPIINLKNLNQHIPYLHFKMEGEGQLKEGRLHGEDRPQRCLLAYSDSPKITEIPAVQVGEEIVRNAGTSIRSRPGAKNIYETNESTPDRIKEINDHDYCLPGRHANNRENQGGSTHGQRLPDFHFTKLRLHNKLGEITTGTSTGNRIPGPYLEQQGNDSLFDPRENCKHYGTLPQHLKDRVPDPARDCELDREAVCNCASCLGCTPAFAGPSTRPDYGSTRRESIQQSNQIIPRFTDRNQVVVKQHEACSREANSYETPRPNNILRCTSRDRLGGSDGRGRRSGGNLDRTREKGFPHQRIRTDGGGTGDKNIHQGKESSINPHLHRQYDSLEVLSQDGRDQECDFKRIFEKDLGISERKVNRTDCGMDSVPFEQSSRLQIPPKTGLQRMGIETDSFRKTLSNMGGASNRLLCIKGNEETSSLHVPGTGSRDCGGKRIVPELGRDLPIHVSTILPAGKSSSKNPGKKVRESYANNTSLARTAMVSNPAIHANQAPAPAAQQKSLLTNHSGKTHQLVESKRLHLTAFLVSGDYGKVKEYHQSLPKLCPKQEEVARQRLTHRHGKSGWCGVVSVKSALYCALSAYKILKFPSRKLCICYGHTDYNIRTDLNQLYI